MSEGEYISMFVPDGISVSPPPPFDIWSFLRPKVVEEIERVLKEREGSNHPKHPYCSNLNPKFFVKDP